PRRAASARAAKYPALDRESAFVENGETHPEPADRPDVDRHVFGARSDVERGRIVRLAALRRTEDAVAPARQVGEPRDAARSLRPPIRLIALRPLGVAGQIETPENDREIRG